MTLLESSSAMGFGKDSERWRKKAKCAGLYDLSSMFFPEHGDDVGPTKSTSVAKKFCLGTEDGFRCPVVEDCLNYALENRIWHGVWGGTSAKERRRLLSRRQSDSTG